MMWREYFHIQNLIKISLVVMRLMQQTCGACFVNHYLTITSLHGSQKKLIYKGEIFNGSKLEHNNTLPYWANIETKFLEQAINAYKLQNKLKPHLGITLTKKHYSTVWLKLNNPMWPIYKINNQ